MAPDVLDIFTIGNEIAVNTTSIVTATDFPRMSLNPVLRWATASLLGLIELIALFGNSVFIFIAFYRPSVQSRTFVFLGSVAAANLGVAFFCIPVSLITVIDGRWLFGNAFCKANCFLNAFWLSGCVFTLTTLSLHKYFSIVRPLRRSLSWKRCVIAILATWILAFSVATITVSMGDISFRPYAAQCGVLHNRSGQDIFQTLFVIGVAYFVPMIINIFAYLRVMVSVKKHSRRVSRTAILNVVGVKAQHHIVRTLLWTFISFAVSWTPFFLYSFVILTGSSSEFWNGFLLITYVIGFSNCAQTPIILVARNPRLRRAVRSLCSCKDRLKRFSIVSLSRAPSSTQESTSRKRKKNMFAIVESPTMIFNLPTPPRRYTSKRLESERQQHDDNYAIYTSNEPEVKLVFEEEIVSRRPFCYELKNHVSPPLNVLQHSSSLVHEETSYDADDCQLGIAVKPLSECGNKDRTCSMVSVDSTCLQEQSLLPVNHQEIALDTAKHVNSFSEESKL